MHRLRAYIRDKNIRLHRIPFEKLEGLTMFRNDSHHICINSTLEHHREKEVIAHELGHIEDGTVDNFVTMLGERRADKIGRAILIPYQELQERIEELGECDLMELSQLFEVPYEVMEKRFHDVFTNQ